MEWEMDRGLCSGSLSVCLLDSAYLSPFVILFPSLLVSARARVCDLYSLFFTSLFFFLPLFINPVVQVQG